VSGRGRPTDPRGLGGSVAGPGGPHDRRGVILDASHAVILDHAEVVALEDHPGTVAMVLSGRVNRTEDRASVMFIFDTDGAAAITTELTALFARAGGELAARYEADMLARVEALVRDGNAWPAGCGS
jgi:hypothetical protein